MILTWTQLPSLFLQTCGDPPSPLQVSWSRTPPIHIQEWSSWIKGSAELYWTGGRNSSRWKVSNSSRHATCQNKANNTQEEPCSPTWKPDFLNLGCSPSLLSQSLLSTTPSFTLLKASLNAPWAGMGVQFQLWDYKKACLAQTYSNLGKPNNVSFCSKLAINPPPHTPPNVNCLFDIKDKHYIGQHFYQYWYNKFLKIKIYHMSPRNNPKY